MFPPSQSSAAIASVGCERRSTWSADARWLALQNPNWRSGLRWKAAAVPSVVADKLGGGRPKRSLLVDSLVDRQQHWKQQRRVTPTACLMTCGYEASPGQQPLAHGPRLLPWARHPRARQPYFSPGCFRTPPASSAALPLPFDSGTSSAKD
jgi:hypothetical protein